MRVAAYLESGVVPADNPSGKQLAEQVYLGISPDPVTGVEGDAQFPVRYEAAQVGSWEELEVTKLPSGKAAARFKAANRWLSSGPDSLLQSRPVIEGQEPGAWEQFECYRDPTGNHGRLEKYESAHLDGGPNDPTRIRSVCIRLRVVD